MKLTLKDQHQFEKLPKHEQTFRWALFLASIAHHHENSSTASITIIIASSITISE